MGSLYNTASIYNAINGISNGGGGVGGVSTTLIKSGTIAVSTGTNTYTIPLPNGLNEGVYLVDANYKTTGSPPTANAFYIYIDQSVLTNTIYYTNHNTNGSTLFQHPTNYIDTPVGTTTLTAGVGIKVSAGTTSGTLYYAVSAVALLNGGVGGGGGSVSGISSLTAGTAISLTGTTTAPTINNTGVISATAGSGITLSSSTGAITITNNGVRTLTAGSGINITGGANTPTIANSGILSIATSGAGISASTTSGATTLQNTGVVSLSADSGIALTGSTGAISVKNVGVVSVSGTTTLASATTNIITTSTSIGSVILSLPDTLSGMKLVSGTQANFTSGGFTNLGNQSLDYLSSINVVSGLTFNTGSAVALDLGTAGNTLNHLLLGTDAYGGGYNFDNLGRVSTGTLIVNDVSNFYSNMIMIGNYNLNVYQIGSNAGTFSAPLNVSNILLYTNATGSGISDGRLMNVNPGNPGGYIGDITATAPQYDTISNPITIRNLPTIVIPTSFGTGVLNFQPITNLPIPINVVCSDISQTYFRLKINANLISQSSGISNPVSQVLLYPSITINDPGGDAYGGIFYTANPLAITFFQNALTPADIAGGNSSPTDFYTLFEMEDIFYVGMPVGNNTLYLTLFGCNGDNNENDWLISNVNLTITFEWLGYYAEI